MRNTARQTRENRTITIDFQIDFQNEATYWQLLDDGKAFLECVLAFVMSLGFQPGLPQAPLKNKGLRLMCPCIHPIESSKPLTFMDIAGVIDGCKILIFLLHGYKKIK